MIKIILPGILSSVQDTGRFGYRKFGVPLSGAMDQYAFRMGNLLLGNKPDAAAIEITGPGFECEFLKDIEICITGADLGAEVIKTGTMLSPGNTAFLNMGDKIKFKQLHSGLRAYLHVRGGIDVPERLGSKSMFRGEKLAAGDVLSIGETESGEERGYYQNSYIEENGEYIIRFRHGPDAGLFPSKYLKMLENAVFTVSSHHDRMGIRLKHELKVTPIVRSIITRPVFPGCIQLPGNGSPIIIMYDGQTTGGYPVWAVIEKENMRIAGQLKSGDKVKFLHV